MSDTHAPLDNAHVHHEESDVNITAIFGFGAGLAAVVLASAIVVWLLFRYFDKREAAATRAYPMAATEAQVPPEPRLQEHPRQDLRELRAGEDRLLQSYGWVDREAGVVRIPIGEAMRLTVERGLPARAAPAAPAKGTAR
jgi:hypothetical protein